MDASAQYHITVCLWHWHGSLILVYRADCTEPNCLFRASTPGISTNTFIYTGNEPLKKCRRRNGIPFPFCFSFLPFRKHCLLQHTTIISVTDSCVVASSQNNQKSFCLLPLLLYDRILQSSPHCRVCLVFMTEKCLSSPDKGPKG